MPSPSDGAGRFAEELNAVSFVHEPVKDAVGQRGITDLSVPAGYQAMVSVRGELATLAEMRWF
jgi:hypothetical protein